MRIRPYRKEDASDLVGLIRALAHRFHLIAPDYPGFGHSDTPDPATFPYTFERIARVMERFLALKRVCDPEDRLVTDLFRRLLCGRDEAL